MTPEERQWKMLRAVHNTENVLTPALMRLLPESAFDECCEFWCDFSKEESLHFVRKTPNIGSRFYVEITDNVFDDTIACRNFIEFSEAREAVAFVLREGRLP